MNYISQILFLLSLIAVIYFFSKRTGRIRKNIQLGKAEDRSDNPSERFKIMAMIFPGPEKDV
jgi:hypothetical protein